MSEDAMESNTEREQYLELFAKALGTDVTANHTTTAEITKLLRLLIDDPSPESIVASWLRDAL